MVNMKYPFIRFHNHIGQLMSGLSLSYDLNRPDPKTDGGGVSFDRSHVVQTLVIHGTAFSKMWKGVK